MELLDFNAGSYWRLSGLLGQLIPRLDAGAQGFPISPDMAGTVGATLREVTDEIQKLELTSALKQAERIGQYIRDRESIAYDKLRNLVTELQVRIIDDLDSRFFLLVPLESVNYYKQGDPLFGKDVET
ncbi:MAG: hypothetical protein ACHP79_02400, partial [Terriglobales bacterium]